MPTDGARVLGGSGPAVLLIPGGAETSDGFFPGLPDGLLDDPGCRVILYDRPGAGTSSKDGSLAESSGHIAAMIAELGCGPVVAVGQSLGGAVAALLARDHPESVAGLVLLDPTPINDAAACARLERTMGATAALGRVPGLGALLAAGLRASFARQRRRLRLRADCAEAHARIADLDVAKLARAVRGIAEVSAGFRESDLPRVPAVVVTADRLPHDKVRMAHARLAAALDAPLVSWPGAEHNLQLDHPDETLATVRDLVRPLAASAQPPDGEG